MHKNENRPGYKKTKVGWIPEGWNTITLEEISDFITKGSTPTTYGFQWVEPSENAIPFLRSECVAESGFTESGLNYISREAHSHLKRSAIFPDDILMTITGNVGRVVRFPQKLKEANINQHIARIRVSCDRASNEFVFQTLEHPSYDKHYESILTGQAYPQISLKQVRETTIPFPKKAEQEAIAGVLECWDRGIRNLELKIVKKRLIKKGLMQQLLSGKRRLPSFGAECRIVNGECRIPKDWKTVRLGNVLSIGNGRDYKHLSDGTIPVFGTGGLMTYVNEKLHSGETVFIGRKGTINKPFYYNGDFWTVDTLFFTHKFKNAFPQFIYALFQTINWEKYSEASGVPSLSKTVILKIEVTLPPLEEQQAIANVLGAADGEIEALERKLALWKDQKKFLLNNLVTGTIRLPAFAGK